MHHCEVTTVELSETDLAVDRALADIATSFRFLYDVTPVDLVAARDGVLGHRADPGLRVPGAQRRSGRDHGPAARRAGR